MKSNSMCRRLLALSSVKYCLSWSGSTLASASSIASPTRHWACERRSERKRRSLGLSRLPGSVSSMMNGTASMRNPATPSCSQNATIRMTSARTAGLAMFRSGWNS
jgi:hypothetical protein